MRNKEGIALYLRLSMADGDLGKDNKDESNSIENQRLLLKSYVADHPELSGELREYMDATDIIGLKQNPTNGRRFSPIFVLSGHFSA